MNVAVRLISGTCVLVGLVAGTVAAGEIALTFDDAPRADTERFTGEERTRRLIETLEDAGVDDVFFFVTTRHIDDRSRKRLEQYAGAGFHLANHSHRHWSADRVDVEDYLEDIDAAHGILSEYDSFVPFYRYTFLHHGNTTEVRDRIRTHLDERGYGIGYVTVDNYDWYMDALLQRALETGEAVDYDGLREVYIEVIWGAIQFYDRIARDCLGRSPKHVLLLHENDLAALYVGDLVSFLRSNGWEIISPQDAYADPIASIVPDVLFNNQGRVAAIARSRGWEKRRLVHEAEDEDYLEVLFARRGIFETGRRPAAPHH